MHATTTIDELIEVLEDSRVGFARGAERLERDGYSSLAAMFRDLSDERATFADVLRDADALGDADRDGTRDAGARIAMATVAHRGWVRLREVVAGGDPDAVLGVAESHEERARDLYGSLLADTDPGSPWHALLLHQHAAVKAAHDRVRVARGARRT